MHWMHGHRVVPDAGGEQVLAVVGEQFDAGDELCGCTITVRSECDMLALWVRNAASKAAIAKIRCGPTAASGATTGSCAAR